MFEDMQYAILICDRGSSELIKLANLTKSSLLKLKRCLLLVNSLLSAKKRLADASNSSQIFS